MPREMTEPESFEAAMKRLEDIVDRLQQGDISLEEMLDVYEEGIHLVAYCESKLKYVKERIEELDRSRQEREGEAKTRPPAESLAGPGE